MCNIILFKSSDDHSDLHSFPTRRSSDLLVGGGVQWQRSGHIVKLLAHFSQRDQGNDLLTKTDRKSTRLNSSHVEISYAVFCLKKKKQMDTYLYLVIVLHKASTTNPHVTP